MSLVFRKPVFGIFDQVRHKPCCTIIEDDKRLVISDLGSRGILHPCSENKGADQLRGYCVFVFACAKSGFLITRLFLFHYDNTPMQYAAIFHGCKNDNFQMKNCDIIGKNMDFCYTLEPPCEYTQFMF